MSGSLAVACGQVRSLWVRPGPGHSYRGQCASPLSPAHVLHGFIDGRLDLIVGNMSGPCCHAVQSSLETPPGRVRARPCRRKHDDRYTIVRRQTLVKKSLEHASCVVLQLIHFSDSLLFHRPPPAMIMPSGYQVRSARSIRIMMETQPDELALARSWCRDRSRVNPQMS